MKKMLALASVAMITLAAQAVTATWKSETINGTE